MFKKIGMAVLMLGLITNAYAYNPNNFVDKEILTVHGNRPKVDIELSEITINVEPEDFINGIFEKSITISNEGNIPCRLKLTLEDIPVDLKIDATVDNDFLIKGETTNLNVVIELTDMQETESFSFTIIVEAKLR